MVYILHGEAAVYYCLSFWLMTSTINLKGFLFQPHQIGSITACWARCFFLWIKGKYVNYEVLSGDDTGECRDGEHCHLRMFAFSASSHSVRGHREQTALAAFNPNIATRSKRLIYESRGWETKGCIIRMSNVWGWVKFTLCSWLYMRASECEKVNKIYTYYTVAIDLSPACSTHQRMGRLRPKGCAWSEEILTLRPKKYCVLHFTITTSRRNLGYETKSGVRSAT